MELKIVKDWKTADPFKIPDSVKKKYPDGHFIWAKMDERKLIAKEGMGYEYVEYTEEDKKRGRPKTSSSIASTKEGSTLRLGDSILMVCHKETYNARQKHFSGIVDDKLSKLNTTQTDEIKKISGINDVGETLKSN